MTNPCLDVRHFDAKGLQPFSEAARLYLRGGDAPRIHVPSSFDDRGVCVALSDSLAERLAHNDKSLLKPLKAALKYGFGGFSAGGRNGIFYQRSGDESLERRTERLTNRDADQILAEQMEGCKPIKIVWHEPDLRLVGLYDEQKRKIFLLDFASY